MMTTLLAQNMSDNWKDIRDDWAEYIQEEHKVLMFIICQDMKKYKDISSLLVSSFHELGHYCNSITRAERNSDLIKIFSGQIAKMIVGRWIGSVETGYRTMKSMEIESEIMSTLFKSIYEALVEYFDCQMNDYIDYPKSVFNEKYVETMDQLLKPYLNCYNKEISKDVLADNIYNLTKFKIGDVCESDLSGSESVMQQCDQRIFQCIKDKAVSALKSLEVSLDMLVQGEMGAEEHDNSTLNLCYDDLRSIVVKNKVEEIQGYVADTLLVWDAMSWEYDPEESFLEYIDNIRMGVDITGFLQEEYRNRSEESQRQIESFHFIKDVLQFSLDTMILCMKYTDKYSMDSFIDDNLAKYVYLDDENSSDLLNQSLSDHLFRKSQFIESAFKKYARYSHDNFEDMTMSSDRFYELYFKMHITPDSGFLTEFRKVLNQTLMGLSIDSSQLDLDKSCYEESLADITMCANLKLEAKEYLAVVMNYFAPYYELDCKWKPHRLVIVLSYIWFIRDGAKKDWKERNLDELIDLFGQKMEELRVESQRDNFAQSVSEMIELIDGKYPIVMDSRLFEVTMERVNRLKSYFSFLSDSEKDDIGFIHEDLKSKLLKRETNKPDKVQQEEIEFLLKYYYKNRMRYVSEME